MAIATTASRTDVVAKAEALRRWAELSGVFSQGRSAMTLAPVDGAAAPIMFSGSAVDTFSAKPITAIGFAASTRRGPRLFVYTRRKLTKAEQKKLVDSSKLDLPLEFRVATPFSVTTPSAAPPTTDMFRKKRLTCGSSISIGNNREAGTLGALLRDSKEKLFGLSCNHVTGGCSNARVNMPIVSPGILDVAADGPHLFTLGLHARALQFIQGDPSSVPSYKDNCDTAAFEILEDNSVSSWQGGFYDTPAIVADPEEDALVEKVGRSTRHTKGIIESRLVGPQRIDYNLTVHHSAEENIVFRGSVFFEPIFMVRGTSGDFAREGDSGALVVTRENGKDPTAVGMIIGGRAGESYMVPLKPLLNKLGMKLVTGHG
jgi:hypothetical protein